ncbi:Maf family protein [Pelomicrobium methylotrophicum]|uniref:7-methyl-GTP pyrophosphatase n=1 Tax=Pelomicrobium methylotrophicum TaxID=2602750 RepID=A0A5C7EME1_9PROT|nr:Maf family nucleotide pyrophosphatase [Pelomicrobium methylotrophicum]TXF13643.1 septum formation inhibitor Maf [Pelomicrobium methylotrophicum]
MPPVQPRIVLASTSRYRRDLLARLGIDFDIFAPNVDESPLPGEAPQALALRLSRLKAEAARQAYPAALIIGSDQVAVLDQELLGKPGDYDNAYRQLQGMSGRQVEFHTAVSLLNSATGSLQSDVAVVRVRFRRLSDEDIRSYLSKEPAFDCAGSARVESLGIALCERVESDDPTALVGLPLITVVSMLQREGVSVL